MSDSRGRRGSPGELVRMQVALTASGGLLIIVAIMTCLFIEEPSWRPGISFFGVAAGIAAGILSAFYVGRGLEVTIEQRDRALREEKISRAFALAQRWNEPNFAKLREDWRALLDEIEGKDAAVACGIVEGDHHKKTVAADVMNFFEEVAFAARSAVADMETLKNVHRSIVVHYYSTISPWIEKVRRDRRQPTAYEHFEWLTNQWK